MASSAYPARVAARAYIWAQRHQSCLSDALGALVDLPTPSGDVERLRDAADWLERRFSRVARLEIRDELETGPHLVFEIGQPGGALVLCHYDTVWPANAVRTRPFRAVDGIAYGPGVFDMKAGIITALGAAEALHDLGIGASARVSLSPDEEIGNPASRARLAGLAAETTEVLVLEPAWGDEALKTRRKGITELRIDVTGRAAHAGTEPERGANAAVAAAHLILQAVALADVRRGTTVNIGAIHGGDRHNIVPDHARIVIDVRAWTARDMHRVCAALALEPPPIAGTTIRVVETLHRPPMPRRRRAAPLVDRARLVASGIGLQLRERGVGGGSEANLVAAGGAPVIDGLGPTGGGAHATDEHVSLHSLCQRVALLAGLMATPP